MQFDIIFQPDTLLIYLKGIGVTLELLIAALALGALLSVPLALLRCHPHRLASGPVWLLTYVVRGTPLLLQVYLIYYGVAQLPWIQERWNSIWPWTMFKGPLFCTILAFTINTTAYTIEIIAGAIKAVPAGEVEAAAALGMRFGTRLVYILLPQALRRSIPVYGNEVILMLQATSVASVVPSVIDLTGAAGSIYSTYYLPFEAYLTAAVLYLMMTFMLIFLLRRAEQHWLAPLTRGAF